MSSAISTHPESRVGTHVIYKLTEDDVRKIVASRLSAGRGTVTGNDPHEGDEYPALIVRDWAMYGSALEEKFKAGVLTDGAGTPRSWADHVREATCNLQVFLDGTDVYWATSRSKFDPALHGAYALDTTVNQPLEGPGIRTDKFVPDAKGHWFVAGQAQA